ncbi:MAG: DUF4437 domain-containing protein [Thiobacillus sp.]|nr:DUF4437 domain-containing protein [Thiobacillus sp.]
MKSTRYMSAFLSIALAGVASAVGSSTQAAADPLNEVILASEVNWAPLNPARGDKSPQAATLWGNRSGAGPTGFLVKFVDGFSSPAHIHNVSYRGVVISGLIHNDDPVAAAMWMPTGSFWTQPKGEAHITAAKGHANVAYIEIEQGPYLVLHAEQAFDSGERPMNMDATNIVWLTPSNTTQAGQPGASAAADAPKVSVLWGNPQGAQLHGALVRLPAGFNGKIRSHGSTFRAVVIKGQPQYQVSPADTRLLEPGSYFGSGAGAVHRVSSSAKAESVIYVRTDGRFEITPTRPRK